MCKFFSFNSDGKGNFYCFNWKIRQKIISGKLDYEADSHTSTANYFNLNDENKLNKYAYNPLTKKFTIEQINTIDDWERAEIWVKELDFSKIVEPLIIKPIIHPFKIKAEKVTEEEIKLLQNWASVGIIIREGIWDSVWYSVWDNVRNIVGHSIGDSIWASIGNSIRHLIWGSVRQSIKDTIWFNVSDSIWGYFSSFFKLSYHYSYKSCIRLWEKGFVPSFDGEVWRLHAGEKARVVFKISEKKLQNYK